MPFKGCLSDACVLMKIERFVLKPLRKIERFVLKQHTFRFADYIKKKALTPQSEAKAFPRRYQEFRLKGT